MYILNDDTVITIKRRSFRNNQLTSVTIPDSVTEMEASAFDVNVKILKDNR